MAGCTFPLQTEYAVLAYRELTRHFAALHQVQFKATLLRSAGARAVAGGDAQEATTASDALIDFLVEFAHGAVDWE